MKPHSPQGIAYKSASQKRLVLEDFVYPSVAYGIPVALYLDGDWTKTAFTLSLTMQHSLPINP